MIYIEIAFSDLTGMHGRPSAIRSQPPSCEIIHSGTSVRHKDIQAALSLLHILNAAILRGVISLQGMCAVGSIAVANLPVYCPLSGELWSISLKAFLLAIAIMAQDYSTLGTTGSWRATFEVHLVLVG